ncbi:MAG: GNAT family N-acetyltransferase [Clostridia bacterium]|nr:GNAT family N-acetyltransferase [Clostridia bacterium]
MKIRKATGEEMRSLWDRLDMEIPEPTEVFFYQNISSGNADFWTIDDDDELIGELYAFYDLPDSDFADGKTTAYLCAFRVRKGYRGKGLGSLLMTQVLEDLRNKGLKRVTIGVGPDEPQNVRLYRRFGFTTKIKDCHYDPCGMDENGEPEYEEEPWWLLSREL